MEPERPVLETVELEIQEEETEPKRPFEAERPVEPEIAFRAGIEAGRGRTSGRGRRFGRSSPRPRRGSPPPKFIGVSTCKTVYGLDCSGLCSAADGLIFNIPIKELSHIHDIPNANYYQGVRQKRPEDRVYKMMDWLEITGVLRMPPIDERDQIEDFLGCVCDKKGKGWSQYIKSWKGFRVELDKTVPQWKLIASRARSTQVRKPNQADSLENLNHSKSWRKKQNLTLSPCFHQKMLFLSIQIAGLRMAIQGGMTQEEFIE